MGSFACFCGGVYSVKMPFSRTVEIGRVALVNYGKDAGTLFVIVDVLDMNRVWVDAPNKVRGIYPLKRMSITPFKVEGLEKCPKKQVLLDAIESSGVFTQFKESAWGKKLEYAKNKAALSDFDRYKVMVARVKKSGIVKRELAKLM